jgi:hypothetical protein
VHQHRELLTAAGWLALLVGCLEYDLGMRAGAEATKTAAQQLGTEAGATKIVGWTHEMSAWFALTQGRYSAVIDAVNAGRAADRGHLPFEVDLPRGAAMDRVDQRRVELLQDLRRFALGGEVALRVAVVAPQTPAQEPHRVTGFGTGPQSCGGQLAGEPRPAGM